jgi:hypothetical protein
MTGQYSVVKKPAEFLPLRGSSDLQVEESFVKMALIGINSFHWPDGNAGVWK